MIVRQDSSRFTDFLILREDQGPDALLAAGTKIQDVSNTEIHPACGSLRPFSLHLHIPPQNAIYDRAADRLINSRPCEEIGIGQEPCTLCRDLAPGPELLRFPLYIISKHEGHVLSIELRQYLIGGIGPLRIRHPSSRAP